MTKQKNDATTTINQPAVSKTAAAAPTPSETAAKAASTTALTPTNVSDGFDSVDDGGPQHHQGRQDQIHQERRVGRRGRRGDRPRARIHHRGDCQGRRRNGSTACRSKPASWRRTNISGTSKGSTPRRRSRNGAMPSARWLAPGELQVVHMIDPSSMEGFKLADQHRRRFQGDRRGERKHPPRSHDGRRQRLSGGDARRHPHAYQVRRPAAPALQGGALRRARRRRAASVAGDRQAGADERRNSVSSRSWIFPT